MFSVNKISNQALEVPIAKPRFGLEKAIADWREQMRRAGLKSPALIDELEAHLREEVERKIKSGLPAQAAFADAIRELGRTDMLQNEFKKIDGPARLAEWFMIGICAVLVAFIVFLGGATVLLCFTETGDRLMAAVAMVCSVALPFCWRRAVPYLPVFASAWKRLAASLVCIITGIAAACVYCNCVLPHFQHGEDRMIPSIGFWAVFLIALFACPGIGLGLSKEDRERLGMVRSN